MVRPNLFATKKSLLEDYELKKPLSPNTIDRRKFIENHCKYHPYLHNHDRIDPSNTTIPPKSKYSKQDPEELLQYLDNLKDLIPKESLETLSSRIKILSEDTLISSFLGGVCTIIICVSIIGIGLLLSQLSLFLTFLIWSVIIATLSAILAWTTFRQDNQYKHTQKCIRQREGLTIAIDTYIKQINQILEEIQYTHTHDKV